MEDEHHGIKKSLQKRIVTVLAAGMIMIPGAYGLAPAPVAHAEFGWGSIIGAGIQGAAAHAQLTAFLKKYNDSEEGRQEFFEEMKKQYGVNDNAYYNRKIDTIMANLTAAIGAVDPRSTTSLQLLHQSGPELQRLLHDWSQHEHQHGPLQHPDERR